MSKTAGVKVEPEWTTPVTYVEPSGLHPSPPTSHQGRQCVGTVETFYMTLYIAANFL